MNDLSQMHAFDVFPWREGGSGGETRALGGVSSGKSKTVSMLNVCLLSKFTIPTT